MNNSHMNDFYDIFGVWHEPWWQSTTCKVFVLILTSTIVIWIAYRIFKKILTKKKVRPYWEVALTNLENLRAPKVFATDKAKNFYFQLTSILKRYITERYGVAAQGSTEKEILTYLEDQIKFPKETLPVLRDIFYHASSIKFANEPALIEQMEQDLALGMRLVKETIPLNK